MRVDKSSHSELFFYVFDATGRQVNTLDFRPPDAERVELHDFSVGPAGEVALCGWAYSSQSKRVAFVAIQRSDGAPMTLVQTNPYSPWLLAVASDGSVWTVGPEEIVGEDGHQSGTRGAGNIIRHFWVDGTVLASTMPKHKKRLLRLVDGYLVVSNDRLGWYSPTHGDGVYVEISTSSFQATAYPGVPLAGSGDSVSGFTLTQGGEAYAFVESGAPPKTRTIYRFDRSTKAWDPLPGVGLAGKGFWELKGDLGESLVLAESDKSRLTVVDPR